MYKNDKFDIVIIQEFLYLKGDYSIWLLLKLIMHC
nr:MAG TPA: Endonuclease/Exonuclease/phosphatase family protein [Bacteriophage sp.]